MAEELILQGRVLWSYDYEFAQISQARRAAASIVSGVGPLHHHHGYIGLTDSYLIIEGDDNNPDINILLSTVDELYLGFDDILRKAL